jgi:ferric-dicitrate binding protein FerR (iron transport regulator)
VNVQQAKRLAYKVLANEANPEEKAALQQYIKDNAHLPGLEEQLFPLQELTSIPDSTLPAGMEEKILTPLTGGAIPTRRPVLRKLLRICAAAAVLLTVCLASYRFFSTYRTPVILQTLVTPNGSQHNITLADGTRIRLNGGTTLRYPSSFTGKTREVYLDGEAFFEVSKDSSHPFIIHAPAFTTMVLGTSFNIKSAAGLQLSEVAVASGKVRVAATVAGTADSVAYLKPGEAVYYRLNDPAGIHKSSIALNAIGAWKDRRFHYDQTPLYSILHDMESAYGLHFQVVNPAVLSCTFSATFNTMTATEILQTLTLMSQVKFQTKDSLTEVSGQACN